MHKHTLSEFVGNTAQLPPNQSQIAHILPQTGHPCTFCVTGDGHEENRMLNYLQITGILLDLRIPNSKRTYEYSNTDK